MPVVVDFWAAWCGPCRILGPVLEKLESEQRDHWKLVKVDTDRHPELSARYGIRGIPAVKLFVGGEVVDEFTGALPEHAVRNWLGNAIPDETRQRLAEAEQLIENGDVGQAQDILESVLDEDSGNPAANGLLAGLIVFSDPDRAATLAVAAASDARFAVLAEAIRQLSEARAKHREPGAIEAEPGGEEYLRASRLLDEGDLDGAIQSLIEVLKLNRYLDDDGARKTGVALFTLLGNAHPLTRAHRRMFDMWLY